MKTWIVHVENKEAYSSRVAITVTTRVSDPGVPISAVHTRMQVSSDVVGIITDMDLVETTRLIVALHRGLLQAGYTRKAIALEIEAAGQELRP